MCQVGEHKEEPVWECLWMDGGRKLRMFTTFTLPDISGVAWGAAVDGWYFLRRAAIVTP